MPSALPAELPAAEQARTRAYAQAHRAHTHAVTALYTELRLWPVAVVLQIQMDRQIDMLMAGWLDRWMGF